jgi:hypothetical protein
MGSIFQRKRVSNLKGIINYGILKTIKVILAHGIMDIDIKRSLNCPA